MTAARSSRIRFIPPVPHPLKRILCHFRRDFCHLCVARRAFTDFLGQTRPFLVKRLKQEKGTQRVLDSTGTEGTVWPTHRQTRHALVALFALDPVSTFADYELRAGNFRVLYRVEETETGLKITIAISGREIRNKLIVEGEELEL